MSFKKLLFSACIAAASFVTPSHAAEYPNKPIELVIPYAAGGATDVIGRMVAEGVSKELGQTIVPINKPGAGTTVAAFQVANAKPDGYTLYTTTAAHTISANLYSQLNYDPIEDFAPIHLVAKIPIVLVVNKNFDVDNLEEFIEKSKSDPNGIAVGSPGNGSPQHLTQALFQSRTDANLLHIPYRGDAPLVADLVSGQVDAAFITLSAALQQIQAGQLKPIALANPTRIEAIKDVPTMEEAGLEDFNAATWFGFFAPAGMDEEKISIIDNAIRTATSSEEFINNLENMGAEMVNDGPEDFSGYVLEETEQWKKAIDISGAQID